jgi:GH43 family beta-xylosidase
VKRRLFDDPRPFPGQDPWVVPYDDSFLLVQSGANNRKIVLKQFSHPGRMHDYVETVVWSPRGRSDHAHQIWAPELHELDGCWYLYYAASGGRIRDHRMYALEADDPFGPYREMGKMCDPSHDVWSIDLTVLEHDGDLFGLWSSWEGPTTSAFQNLYIARMSNPWTISGERHLISRPEHGWEMTVAAVNEGPQVLRNPRGSRLFIVYSADASWSHAYKMGVLELTGDDVLDPKAWTKLDRPIFTGGGHGCFLEIDGEKVVFYHRKMTADPGWADREIRCDVFTWDSDGYPVVTPRNVTRPVTERSGVGPGQPVTIGFPSAADTATSAPFAGHRIPSPTRSRRRSPG